MLFVPGLASIPRGLLAIAAVWLMSPHQPDIGYGRPEAIDTLIAGTSTDHCVHYSSATCDGALFDAMLGSIAGMQKSRSILLDAIARVRGDLRANGTPIGALSRNGAS